MKKKKFSKLREWNRRRNYLMKRLRMDIARFRFDTKERRHFDFSQVQRVLFLRDDDKIGDMVVSTSLFREFGQAGLHIDVLAGKNSANVITHNSYIKKIITISADEENSLKLAKQLSYQPYDLVVDMGDQMSPQRLRFLSALKAKNLIGFNKDHYNLYNKSIAYDGFNLHITERYKSLLKTLGFNDSNTQYDLHTSEEVRQQVAQFLASLPQFPNVVLNPFTADKKRDLSHTQCHELVDKIKSQYSQINIILVGTPNKINELKIPGTYINPFNTLESAIEIIHHANLVISPDTSIVHIAAAWEKPLVCLYGHDMHGKFINSMVWGPGNPRSIQLFTKSKEHSVSTISVDEIIDSLNLLF